MRAGVVAFFIVAACAEQPKPSPPPVDPCADMPVVRGGSVELGQVDRAFAPISDGDDLTLQPASEHLYVFVVSARTFDLDVGKGAWTGTVAFTAFDLDGAMLSLQVGCRAREFTAAGAGTFELASTFGVPFAPDVARQIDGTTITISVVVRDHDGRRATSSHSIVARMP